MTKSIGSITPNALKIGAAQPEEVMFIGSGFDATHSNNRVVLNLKETGRPSGHVTVTHPPLHQGHSQTSLRVNISGSLPLVGDLADIEEAENRVFVPAVELLDAHQHVIETIPAPAGLVIVFCLITSISPSQIRKGTPTPVTFYGIGFDKTHYNNVVFLTPRGSTNPIDDEGIPADQPANNDASMTFKVNITVDVRGTYKPTVNIMDETTVIRTVHPVDNLWIDVV